MLLIKFFLIFLLGVLPFNSQTNSESIGKWAKGPLCEIDNATFEHDEELKYRVYYNWGLLWLNAAEVVFKVHEKKEGYHITAVGKTLSSYEWLYKVHDRYEVMVDKKTLLPIWSIRKIHENEYRLYEKLLFDQSKQTVTSIKGRTEKDITIKKIDIDDCGHDILSILYFVRNFAFEKYNKGQTFPVSVFMDRVNNKLFAKFHGVKKKQAVKGLGEFNTFLLSPSTIEGSVFNKGAMMDLYISEDKNHIPVMIEADLKVGTIKVMLKSYKGLRHPLSSRLQ